MIAGFRVECCSCGLPLYETSESYDPKKPLTGDQLQLLPFYKYWPTYDGALAVKSTSRFMMFCSQCGGYVSTTGKLKFHDFPDEKVHIVSAERSALSWTETEEPVKGQAVSDTPVKVQPAAYRPKLKLKTEPITPQDMMDKMMDKMSDKTTPKKKKRKRKGK